MLIKKMIWAVLMLLIGLLSSLIAPSVYGKDGSSQSKLLGYAGKSYTGAKDPSYLAYDSALRDHMVNRMDKRFGISLDPKTYSGFDLLEIEALLKCKKSGESFDLFLKMFPKNP